jgi:hypothetical protein
MYLGSSNRAVCAWGREVGGGLVLCRTALLWCLTNIPADVLTGDLLVCAVYCVLCVAGVVLEGPVRPVSKPLNTAADIDISSWCVLCAAVSRRCRS